MPKIDWDGSYLCERATCPGALKRHFVQYRTLDQYVCRACGTWYEVVPRRRRDGGHYLRVVDEGKPRLVNADGTVKRPLPPCPNCRIELVLLPHRTRPFLPEFVCARCRYVWLGEGRGLEPSFRLEEVEPDNLFGPMKRVRERLSELPKDV